MKKIFLLLIALGLSSWVLTAQADCPNLVKNGDFEAGSSGFTSGLSPNCNCTSSTYCVSTNFNLKCSGWPNFADHTPTGVGNYLLIDGSGSPAIDVWSTTVTVVPGSAYTFSFWVAAVYPTSQQTLDLGMMVNGVNVKPITFTQVAPSWTNYTFSGIVPAGITALPIAIRQINGGGFNDFGIDDVSFTACGSSSFFACDSVVVTCEATMPNDPVAAIINVSNIAAQADNTQWASAAITARHSINSSASGQFSRANLGQVFGICYKPNGDIFLASTSIYQNDAWGSINNTGLTSNGIPANSGSIYRIDGTSITEFADLPNRGQGLGNLCYDALHNLIFATNFYDGLIYSINGTTGAFTTFNPNFNGFSGTTSGTFPVFAPLGQRPWGIAYYGSTLYYSRWSADGGNQTTGQRNEIWSVGLNALGVPTGAETLIYTMPFYFTSTYSNPVSDIEISRSGTRMLLAERSMGGSSSSAHNSRLIELTGAGLLWSNQPLSKFNLGSGGSGTQSNCTGGADYGDLDLNLPIMKTCDSSVWTMSDFMTSVTGFGVAYGVQVLKPTGGNQLNSKIIDLNNVPGTQDKTRIGDVDYFRCLDCAPQTGQTCDFYRPGLVDSVCCRATLNATQLTGIPAITSIGYVVTGGVIQGFTSSCIVANPTTYSGTASGTVTFTGTCTNMQFINAALTSTSATGNVTVTWTVNFANGTSCTYQSFVKNCPHPVQLCDSFAIKQCICTGSTLSYVDIKIINLMIPNSPICSVKVQYYNSFNVLTSGFWATASVAAPFSATTFDPTLTFIPSTGSLSVNTSVTINPQMYFLNPFNASFPGSVTVTVYHCNGDSCVKSWKPTPQPIGQISDVEVVKAKAPYSKYYVAAFKVKSKAGVNTDNLQFKYFTIGISESSAGAVKPEIVAVTGAQMYKEREGSAVSLALSSAAHGRENALFELTNDYTTRDSLQFVHVIFGGALPRTLITTFYQSNGSIIGTDSVKLDSLTTGIAEQLRGNTPSLFLVSGAPNPAKEAFNATIIINEMRTIDVGIYDITGNLVGHQSAGKLPIGTHEIAVPTQHLPNGTYIVKIKSAEDPVGVSIKMVVMH
jgi:hypothetical protein